MFTNFSLSTLSEGGHSFLIFVNDSAGNFAVSSLIWFTIDTTSPNITIISPTTNIYDSNAINLIYSISEESTVTIYIDDVVTSVVNSSLLEGLTDGSHNLTIKAVDSVGNVAYSEVIFTINTSTISTTSTTSTTSTASTISSSSQPTTTNSSKISSGFITTSPNFTIMTLLLSSLVGIPLMRYKRRKNQ